MKKYAKWAARRVFGDYSIYFIYACDDPGPEGPTDLAASAMRCQIVDEGQIASSTDAVIAGQVEYCGPDSHAFACFAADRVVAACFYWFGERYRRRNFWPLKENEAKLVQIVTVADMRGRGVAASLIAFSSREMRRRGFENLYARIWHSNEPSLRAFSHAGWRRIALVIEVFLLGKRKTVRIGLEGNRRVHRKASTT